MLRRLSSSTCQERDRSGDAHHNEAEVKPDFDQMSIQFEELLPEQKPDTGKYTSPALHPSLERSAVTLGTPVKVERESLTDIYDASPRGHVNKAANLGQAQTSKSTAQPTTPASSPERKSERQNSIGGVPLVKLEVNLESDGRQTVFDSSCTPPASISEKHKLPNRPMKNVSTPPSTPKESLHASENITNSKKCCKMLCSQCTPKDVWEEYGLGPPEKRPNIPRLKSLSAYPSSVSSFGADDGIPTSDKMHREVGKILAESSKIFASDQLSEISPSLQYSHLLARLGKNYPASINKEDDIYDNFEEDSLPPGDSCRMIFGKEGQIMADHGREGVTERPQRSQCIEDYIRKSEKKLEQISGRPLRSFSADSDLSKEFRNLDEECNGRDEDDSLGDAFTNLSSNVESGEDGDSGSEYEDETSRRASTRAPLKVRSSSQRMKRTREATDDWQPTFSDNEDVANEDGFVEIDKDVFVMSENRRKKRHKSKSRGDNMNSVPASPAPKEELATHSEDVSTEAQDPGTADTGNKNTAENTEQEKTPCDYYMNTYWIHGRASDGRRVRDGFVSYVHFKEYCRRNNQPTDDRCMLLFKKDLKHYMLCEHHGSLRQDLLRVAWNFEHNPGFSFKSCSKDEETRRIQNEAIGNVPSPGSSARRSTARGVGSNVSEDQLKAMIGHVETAEEENKKLKSKLKCMLRNLGKRS